MTRARRGLLSSLTLVAVALAMGACGDDDDVVTSTPAGTGTAAANTDALRGQTIVVETFGGVFTEAEKKYFGEPFTKETGIKVRYEEVGSPTAPALLQQESGNVKIDIVMTENAEVLRAKDFLAEFPPDLMTTLEQTSDPTLFNEYVVRFGATAVVLVCNPEVMKKCPTNPQEFWDVEHFPGPRGMQNVASFNMQLALTADGVAPDALYPMDVERAAKKLKEIKPDIKVFAESGAQQQQLLVDKEVGAAYFWNGRAFVVKNESIPDLEFHWEGSTTTSADGMVVLKDAPHKEAAFAYLKWIMEHPQAQADWATELAYITPSKELLNLVPAAVKEALPTANGAIPGDDKWVADHSTEIQKAWQEVLAG